MIKCFEVQTFLDETIYQIRIRGTEPLLFSSISLLFLLYSQLKMSNQFTFSLSVGILSAEARWSFFLVEKAPNSSDNLGSFDTFTIVE